MTTAQKHLSSPYGAGTTAASGVRWFAVDPSMAAALWTFSEAATGVRYVV